LYAPADFFEKVLFPLARATGTFDATKRQWIVVESRGTPSGSEPAGPLSVDVAVVHVEPTTQVVLRESASARFEPRLIESGLRVVASRVVLTRDTDSAISLDDRTSLANHEKAGLFLSLHANSSRATGAHGSETYYLSLESSDRLASEAARRENQPAPGSTPLPGSATNPDLDFILWDLAQSAHLNESSRLAEAIQRELNVVSKTENRGIKQAPFRVLAGATMPAVLVEVGFISHPDEEKQLRSATFQENVASAIATAVGEFFAKRP